MKRLIATLALATSPALAQPAPPANPPPADSDATSRAKTLYLEGKRYYDVADYDHAIEVWKKAYVIATAPMLLFNIGQAYRLKGDCASALRFYANFEREAGTADRTEVDQAKARCNPQPTNANPPTTFPPHAPATPGDVDTFHEPAREVIPSDTGGTYRTAGVATGVAGAVLVGVGLYLGQRARSDAQQVSDYRGEWTTVQSDLQHGGQTAATWGAISLGVGIAGVAGGVALYYLGAQRRHVDVALAPHAAGLTWAASF